MSFKSGVRSASEQVFGEYLCELPGTLLDGCDDIQGFVVMAVLMLVLCGLLVAFLGMATAVGEALSSGGFQQLGLK